jgi:cysteine desulfuration protein SufE
MNTPVVQPSIDSLAAELREEFAYLEDWQARYAHVIDLGRALPPLSDAERSEANRVRGCASQVWLIREADRPTLTWRGDSDSALVKGLVALVLKLYSGQTAQAIRNFDAAAFFKNIGIAEAITPQRSNGLASMIARIKADVDACGTA